MRRPIVAGNWKMHGTLEEATALARRVAGAIGSGQVEVVLCPPFTALRAVAEAVAGTGLLVGGQDLHWERRGAFTGEISAEMLVDAGCRYVIVGHSERRIGFGESDDLVGRKALAALEGGLTPIVCVGETLEEREAGRTELVLRSQLESGLGRLARRLGQLVVAYEPVWAIGTGRTATVDQAQAAQAFIRSVLGELAGEPVAHAVRIQYGGSVKPENARELLISPDIDGGLIGGASLDAAAFVAIVRAAGGA